MRAMCGESGFLPVCGIVLVTAVRFRFIRNRYLTPCIHPSSIMKRCIAASFQLHLVKGYNTLVPLSGPSIAGFSCSSANKTIHLSFPECTRPHKAICKQMRRTRNGACQGDGACKGKLGKLLHIATSCLILPCTSAIGRIGKGRASTCT